MCFVAFIICVQNLLLRHHSAPTGDSSASLPSSNDSSASISAFALQVRTWSLQQVGDWLLCIGLPQYRQVFEQVGSVNGELLVEMAQMQDQELESLIQQELKVELKLHRMKLVREMKKLLSANAFITIASSPALVPVTGSISTPLPSTGGSTANSVAAATVTMTPPSPFRFPLPASNIFSPDFNLDDPTQVRPLNSDDVEIKQQPSIGSAYSTPRHQRTTPATALQTIRDAYHDPVNPAHSITTPTPAVSAPPIRQLPTPRTIPFSELTLKHKIGQGHFGTVYLATWRGTKVAVKKLHAQHWTAEQMQMLLREAALMELLNHHPNSKHACFANHTVPCASFFVLVLTLLLCHRVMSMCCLLD